MRRTAFGSTQSGADDPPDKQLRRGHGEREEKRDGKREGGRVVKSALANVCCCAFSISWASQSFGIPLSEAQLRGREEGKEKMTEEDRRERGDEGQATLAATSRFAMPPAAAVQQHWQQLPLSLPQRLLSRCLCLSPSLSLFLCVLPLAESCCVLKWKLQVFRLVQFRRHFAVAVAVVRLVVGGGGAFVSLSFA